MTSPRKIGFVVWATFRLLLNPNNINTSHSCMISPLVSYIPTFSIHSSYFSLFSFFFSLSLFPYSFGPGSIIFVVVLLIYNFADFSTKKKSNRNTLFFWLQLEPIKNLEQPCLEKVIIQWNTNLLWLCIDCSLLSLVQRKTEKNQNTY